MTTSAPVISTLFRSILATVDNAHNGLGATVADMLDTGFCEYLTFEEFRQAVKSGLSPAAWATVTNYMAPMGRAWANGKASDFAALARADGIKAALKAFPAGTGKKGAPVAVAPEAAPETAPVITAVPPTNAEAEATRKADEAIREADKAMELDSLKAENAELTAMLNQARAQVAALTAENEALKAQAASKGKAKAKAAAV